MLFCCQLKEPKTALNYFQTRATKDLLKIGFRELWVEFVDVVFESVEVDIQTELDQLSVLEPFCGVQR